MATRPTTAMVLAAGLGTRMRPLHPMLPKPLVPLAGRALIDHVLDRLGAAGIARAVVNVHHKADLIEAHLRGRERPSIAVSDERAGLLDTGGGVRLALRCGLLGDGPFLVHNSDSVWIEAGASNLGRMLEAWRAGAGDCLLLLAERTASLGYGGSGDFDLDAVTGRIRRRAPGATADFVFAGVSIMRPDLLLGTPEGPFSLNRIWDEAMARGRLHGLVLAGTWMHVGDPAAHAAAERRIAGDGR